MKTGTYKEAWIPMVGFAFIFLAVILLMPILLIVGVVDFLAIRMRPPLHLQRGFEVLPPTAAPREKK